MGLPILVLQLEVLLAPPLRLSHTLAPRPSPLVPSPSSPPGPLAPPDPYAQEGERSQRPILLQQPAADSNTQYAAPTHTHTHPHQRRQQSNKGLAEADTVYCCSPSLCHCNDPHNCPLLPSSFTKPQPKITILANFLCPSLSPSTGPVPFTSYPPELQPATVPATLLLGILIPPTTALLQKGRP